jgi:hypothetical protein
MGPWLSLEKGGSDRQGYGGMLGVVAMYDMFRDEDLPWASQFQSSKAFVSRFLSKVHHPHFTGVFALGDWYDYMYLPFEESRG